MSKPGQSIFNRHADFDPAGDLDAFLKSVPARWVVYLLADADDRPVQLLCVKNLRASLKRRLGGDEMVGPTRRVNYRDLVRRVYWRRVDSALESDFVYYDAARRIFPESYQGMVGFRPAWFLHVDPDAAFPRYIKTIDLSDEKGVYVGPMEDKHAAGKLIQVVEDGFDLCRYYNILVEAPRGRACAYKEMGKCPAPCDGSIDMDHYRHMIELSAKVLVDPSDYVREHEARMRQAAGELKFEVAWKIKQYVEQLQQFGQGPFRHVRRLRDFAYLSLQRGPHASTAKVFLITPGVIEEIAAFVTGPQHVGDVLRRALELADQRKFDHIDASGAELVGVVTHHLFSAKNTQGVFLPLDTISVKAIIKAFKDVQKQKVVETPEDEGVMKELQAV